MKGFKKTEAEIHLVNDLEDYLPAWMLDSLRILDKDYTEKSEKDLIKNFHGGKMKVYTKLRERFWIEYKNAKADGRKMVGLRITTAVCSQATFSRYLDNPDILSYILIPPANFISEIGLLLREHALDFYNEILEADLYKTDSKGNVVLDINLARLKKSVIDDMQNRVYGTAVQNQNIIQNTTTKIENSKYDAKIEGMSAIEIQEELKKLGE